jgi:iron only hydrogenase large subunit-like protein
MAEVELTSEAMEVSSSDVKLNHSPRRLRFAKVYGFRNIQSVLLKLKRGKCDLDFVEIMACPSGCVNGGGQLKTAHSVTENGSSDKESPTEIRARVAAVECEYHSSTDVARPDNSPLAQFVYDKLGSPFSARSLELFHTRYHAVPKLEMLAPLAAAAKW